MTTMSGVSGSYVLPVEAQLVEKTVVINEKDFMIWSWFNFILNPFAILCSIPALLASYLAETYNRARDPQAARAKSRLALACNIAALMFYFLSIAVIVAIIMTVSFLQKRYGTALIG